MVGPDGPIGCQGTMNTDSNRERSLETNGPKRLVDFEATGHVTVEEDEDCEILST